MLKVTRAEDPLTVEQLILCIYGTPGLGKTTLGFSASKPILLDFDQGAQRAARRRDSVQIERWSDAASITPADVEPYDTIIIDTAGRALDMLTQDIIQRTPKMGKGGTLTLQGYGALKTQFTAWVKMLRELKKDIILIAHSSEDKSGDEIIERIDMQGGSKGEVYKLADAMGRLRVVPDNPLPYLNFSPSEAAFGKNPGNLEELQIPHIEKDPEFLAGVIQTIKDRINTMTEEQQRRQSAIDDWLRRIRGSETPDDVNALVEEAKKLDSSIVNTVKGAITKHAREELGYEFNREAGGFEAPKQEAAEEAPEEPAGDQEEPATEEATE